MAQVVLDEEERLREEMLRNLVTATQEQDPAFAAPSVQSPPERSPEEILTQLVNPWEGEAPQEEAPLPGAQAAHLDAMDAKPNLGFEEVAAAEAAVSGHPARKPDEVIRDQKAQMAARTRPGDPPQPGQPPPQPASVAEANVRPAEQAADRFEAPGALDMEERERTAARAQRDQQYGDAFAGASDAGGSDSPELARAQRTTNVLTALQSLMGMAGGAMSMTDDEVMSKMGRGIAGVGGALPVGTPMARYNEGVAEDQRGRDNDLKVLRALNAREQAMNQRDFGDNARRRLAMEEEAQAFEMEGALDERKRLSRTREMGSEESARTRSRIENLAASIDRGQMSSFPSEEEIQGVLASGTAEELAGLEERMLAVIDTQKRAVRGGGGGGGGRGGRRAQLRNATWATLDPYIRQQIENAENAGHIVRRADSTDPDVVHEQGLAFVRSLGSGLRPNQVATALQQFVANTETAQARNEQPRRALAEMRSDRTLLDNSAALILGGAGSPPLNDEQIELIQFMATNQNAMGEEGPIWSQLAGNIRQRIWNAWNNLSDQERAQARRGHRALMQVVEKANARRESGAAINKAEWQRFYDRLGLNLGTQTADDVRDAIRQMQDYLNTTINEVRSTMPNPTSTVAGNEGGEAPEEVTITFTHPAGGEPQTFTRGSREARALLNPNYRGYVQGMTWEDSTGRSGVNR